MSRTYKDRPYWVRLNDPSEVRRPFHYHEGRGRFFEEFEACQIDVPYEGKKGEWRRNCGYYLGYHFHRCRVTREFRRLGFYGPLRSDQRMKLRNAVKDYNTFEEVDEDMYLREQNRRSTFYGGYWD